ncbi:hypothetical protein ACN47E_009283 [Coniothyrium glycines]
MRACVNELEGGSASLHVASTASGKASLSSLCASNHRLQHNIGATFLTSRLAAQYRLPSRLPVLLSLYLSLILCECPYCDYPRHHRASRQRLAIHLRARREVPGAERIAIAP